METWKDDFPSLTAYKNVVDMKKTYLADLLFPTYCKQTNMSSHPSNSSVKKEFEKNISGLISVSNISEVDSQSFLINIIRAKFNPSAPPSPSSNKVLRCFQFSFMLT